MAEFEELRLTVTLVDNASSGMGQIRAQIGQLTTTANQLTTSLVHTVQGLSNVQRTVIGTTPAIRGLQGELRRLERSAGDAAGGLVQMGAAVRGLSGLPQVGAGLHQMVGGLSGISTSMRVLAPAAAGASIAILGMVGAVVTLTAGAVIYGIEVFKFSREMHELSKVAKTLGMNFADVKIATDIAKHYSVTSETMISNLQGLQRAQTDLAQNGSKIRQELISKGMDPKWIDQITKETEAWRMNNMILEKGLAIIRERLAKGDTAMQARGFANQLAEIFGQDTGIFDRPPMQPPDPEVVKKLNEIERVSNDIAKVWGDIGDKINDIKIIVLGAGLPFVLTTLRAINTTLDVTGKVFNFIDEKLKLIGTSLSTVIWNGIYGAITSIPGLGQIIRALEFADKARQNAGKLANPGNVPPTGDPMGNPFIQQQSFQGGANDNNPLLHRASFTTQRQADEYGENTSQIEKLTSQLEKINAYLDYRRSIDGGTGTGGTGGSAGRGGGGGDGGGRDGGGAGGRGGRDGSGTATGVGSGGNVQMQGGEQLASGYFAPVTSNKAGGGLGGTSASMGAGKHGGDDYMTPHGTPVHSVKDGKIEKYGRDNQGGMTMTVRHSDGTSATYMHLSKRIAPVGTAVKGGEVIGNSGTANRVEHLHFEMRDRQGRRLSPRDVLGVTKAAREAEAAKQQKQQQPAEKTPPASEKKSEAATPEQRADATERATEFSAQRRRSLDTGALDGDGAEPSNDNNESSRQALFDPRTGEKIPGSYDRMYGVDAPARPGWSEFSQGNVSDERDNLIMQAGRRGLGQRLGMDADQKRRSGEYLLMRAAAIQNLKPNQLSADLGYADLIKAEPAFTKAQEWFQSEEIAKWSGFDRNTDNIDPRTGQEIDRGSLDRGRADIDDMRRRGKFNVNVVAPPGTKVEADGGGLFKGNTEVQRTTEIPYNGPSSSSTARQYMEGR